MKTLYIPKIIFIHVIIFFILISYFNEKLNIKNIPFLGNLFRNNNNNDNNQNIENKKHKNIKETIDSKIKYYENFIEDIKTYNHTHIFSDNIYWCWLQGISNAPKLYKTTFKSVKKNCKNHNIIIINNTNLKEYIRFPSFIKEKFKNNNIDKTHFSDLLRLELLIKYGGTWIDASVLITKYNKFFFKNELFFFKSIKITDNVGSNWFITSEKESPVLKTTRDLLYEYWRKENYLCHYFIFQKFFKFSFMKYIKDYYTNIPVHFLQKYLNKKFNYSIYKNILEKADVHKLTKKKKITKKNSFANYIISSFLNNNK